MLRLVPVAGGLVHVIPGKLVEDQQRSQPLQLVERRPERADVMQYALRDRGVERARVVQLLERDTAVERPVGRVGIDRENVVTCRGQLARDAALAAATHLEHAGRSGRQLPEDIRGEVHAPSNILPA